MLTSRSIGPRVLWIALALGILTHASYLTLDHEHYGVDTPSYLIPADNLLHEQRFVNALQQPELRRTPGYPLLLALFRVSPLRVEYLIFVQHALCVFLIVAVAAICIRITGSSLAALFAASVLALDLATVRIANLLLTEVSCTVLIALAAWTMYRAMTKTTGRMFACAAAGLLGGFSAMVRPVGLLYFVPLSICLILTLKRRALGPAMVLIASFLFLPLLWAARNFAEGNYFGLSTIGAEDLLYYRAAGALAVQQPGGYLANVVKVRSSLIDQTCSDLEQTYQRACSQVTESQQAAYFTRKGMTIIRSNPVSYLRSTVLSLAYIVFGGGAEALSRVSNLSPRVAECIVLLCTVPEACLALVGCWYWYRRDRRLFYLLTLTIAYFLIISAGAEAYSRFRVPVMPMYALLIGGGAALIEQSMRRVSI
jgi:4-amino-4-deoxy-L-arabinose transferase-like glycosyltransferase